jgi:outer membrane protein
MRMKSGAWALTIGGMLLTAVVSAQESAPAPDAAPAPRDVQLLDEVPNYAEILAHQWQSGVPHDVVQAQDSDENYGRLGAAPLQATSLEECVALALHNNTDLQIQRLGPVAATAQVRSAYAVFDPKIFADISRQRRVTQAEGISPFLGTSATQLSLFNDDLMGDVGVRKTLLSGGVVSLAWTNDRNIANPSVLNQLNPQFSTSLGLSLNQPLLRDFGWQYSLLVVEVSQDLEQAAYHQYQATIANLISAVERAYWTLVLTIKNVQVQEQGLAAAQELLRQNEGKFNVGALPHTAVLEAKSEVARRESNLIRARNNRDIARDNLRALLNARGHETPSLLMVDPHDQPIVVPYDPDLDRSLRTGLERRPELVAARLDVHSHGLQRKVAENQLLPRVNFVGALGVNGLSGTAAPVQPTPFAVPNPQAVGGFGRSLEFLPDGRYYNYTVGATIEVPLDNAQAKADYAKANISLDQSRLSLQKLEESITLEIKTAVSNLQSDLKSVEATRIARQLEEENIRNQKARYDVGLATTKDLLDYLDRLTQAQFLEVQALTAYNSDLAEMRRVEGTLLSARNVLIERVTPETAPWWASF